MTFNFDKCQHDPINTYNGCKLPLVFESTIEFTWFEKDGVITQQES